MTVGVIASLIAAGLSVLGVFLRLVVYRRARADARRELQLERAEESAKAARKRQEVEDEVARLGRDDLRERLSRWVRPDRG